MTTQITEFTMIDITAPKEVEIKIREDKKVIWVNVDGACRLRVCKIPQHALSIIKPIKLKLKKNKT